MIDLDIGHRLGDFSLEARFAVQGRIVGLFGPSGAGKTSVVEAIAGTYRPQRGHIRIGECILVDRARGIALAPEARRVGYVFQDALLFPHLSVAANLHYGYRLRRRTMSGAEPVIAPQQVIDLLGLEPLLARRPQSLSGGEKQRVAIGRALLAQPRILLLDEPLAALDAARKDEILDYIEKLRDRTGIPMVYVSHAVEEMARLADAVVLMQAGRVTTCGRAAEVFGAPGMGWAAGALLEATVEQHDEAFALTAVRFDGGQLRMPRLAAAPGTRVRLRILARDVSLARERPAGISILNVLPGRVSAMIAADAATIDVRVQVGAAQVLARITRRSADELALRPGLELFALVKAVSLAGGTGRESS
jgi:molybdate transport system ATP-binding protein